MSNLVLVSLVDMALGTLVVTFVTVDPGVMPTFVVTAMIVSFVQRIPLVEISLQIYGKTITYRF